MGNEDAPRNGDALIAGLGQGIKCRVVWLVALRDGDVDGKNGRVFNCTCKTWTESGRLQVGKALGPLVQDGARSDWE